MVSLGQKLESVTRINDIIKLSLLKLSKGCLSQHFLYFNWSFVCFLRIPSQNFQLNSVSSVNCIFHLFYVMKILWYERVLHVKRQPFIDSGLQVEESLWWVSLEWGTCVIIDDAAGGETKRRQDVTFPLLTLHRGKDCVHFSIGFFKKKNYTGILQIFHTKNRWDIENFAFDAWWYKFWQNPTKTSGLFWDMN
jgi:hypothetical protein